MKYKELLTRVVRAHSSNYRKANRTKKDVDWLVGHYTANDGDSDEGNAQYFQSPNRNASANIFVDDDSITESVDVKDIAWHCGGSVYKDIKSTGGAKYHNICTNTNSIGIEMCDTRKDGVYNLSKKTRDNAIKVFSALMDDFDIDIDHVIRHFDVSGKYCPRYFCKPYGSDAEWERFKADIVKYRAGLGKNETVVEKEPAKVEEISTDIKVGETVRLKDGAVQFNGNSIPTSYKNKEYIVSEIKGTRAVLTIDNIIIYAVDVNNLQSVNKKDETSVRKDYKVRITTGALNVRKGPGINYGINTVIRDRGIYTIIEEHNGWGLLKSKSGWISLAYTSKI